MGSPSIAIVTGPVEWPDVDARVVERELEKLPMGSVVIHGSAAGVDSVASGWCKRAAVYEVSVPYYRRGGRGGGPMRNALMVRIASGLWEQSPAAECIVLAFGEGDAGVESTVSQAARAGIPARRVGTKESVR